MPRLDAQPLLYLITAGTLPAVAATDEIAVRALLQVIAAAVRAQISLVQIREKAAAPRTLYEVTRRAAALTRGSRTRLLVNDRADIARAAGADGVHLTTQSMDTADVRRAFGPDFLIGVSTHNEGEARAAHTGGADFITFGPIYDTPDKRGYGAPLGLARLRAIVAGVAPLPVVALGGIALRHAPDIARSGAAGLAAIRLWSDWHTLEATAQQAGLIFTQH